ncbi:alpha/beta hydrolase family protein [Paenibacillus sp. An7]|uniref:alpha/beta hydrolase family protein n=1 Tax=Paenibacillus sp. An7 TaxID=2689577 RepID=UPI00135C9371|nr:alpha/beta hydrolase family protein [Paenibacillus sp. An7]
MRNHGGASLPNREETEKWNPGHYFAQYSQKIQPESAFTSEKEWGLWRKTLTERLILLLGKFPEYPASLAPVLLERTERPDHIRERIEITTYEGLRMPMYILSPLESRHEPRPVVLALHGHGYGSREIVGLEADSAERTGSPGLHKDFALEWVRRGFIVIAPELLGFGDRRLTEDLTDDPKKSSCQRLALALLMAGETLAGYRVYETMRALDYIELREEADVKRIGCMGISGGGMIASLVSALDERIGAAVISGYANTFEDSILSRNHCLDNYIPGILREARMADLIGLIAPRPLLIEAGSEDQVFPLAGAKRAYTILEQIYETAGVKEKLAADFFTGGHEISGHIAYDWMVEQFGMENENGV